jgi:hypothetical protein
MRSLQKVIVIATLLMVSIPCFSLDIGSGDTVFRYRLIHSILKKVLKSFIVIRFMKVTSTMDLCSKF